MQHTVNSSHFDHVRNTIQSTFGIPNPSIQCTYRWDEIFLLLQIINHQLMWLWSVMKLELQTVKFGW